MSEQSVEWNPLAVLTLRQGDEVGAGSDLVPEKKWQQRLRPGKSPAVITV